MTSFIKEINLSKRTLELKISRPESLNALNSAVISELSEKLLKLESEFIESKKRGEFRDDFPRVVLISGEGEKAFVAGADISALAAESGADFLGQGIALMELLERFPIPVIAVVTGFCLGGGLELALSCDLIFATNNAKLGLPEVTLGIIPGFGGTQRLFRRCGIGTARKLILSAERIDAAAAYQYGIVDLILSDNLVELRGFCEKLEKLSPLALEAAKIALFYADTESKKVGLSKERELFVDLLKTEDAKEGMKAFFEKRPAIFLGK